MTDEAAIAFEALKNEHALAQFRGLMVQLRHAISQTTDTTMLDTYFRDLSRECAGLVPRFKPGFHHLSEMVPEPQLTLWRSRIKNGRNPQS